MKQQLFTRKQHCFKLIKVFIVAFLFLTSTNLNAKEIWVWGNNDDGQLANGITTNTNSPIQIGASVDRLYMEYTSSKLYCPRGTNKN